MERLAAVAQLEEFAKGSLIVEEGTTETDIYVIYTGAAQTEQLGRGSGGSLSSLSDSMMAEQRLGSGAVLGKKHLQEEELTSPRKASIRAVAPEGTHYPHLIFI